VQSTGASEVMGKVRFASATKDIGESGGEVESSTAVGRGWWEVQGQGRAQGLQIIGKEATAPLAVPVKKVTATSSSASVAAPVLEGARSTGAAEAKGRVRFASPTKGGPEDLRESGEEGESRSAVGRGWWEVSAQGTAQGLQRVATRPSAPVAVPKKVRRVQADSTQRAS
jgi:hypothetical protein